MCVCGGVFAGVLESAWRATDGGCVSFVRAIIARIAADTTVAPAGVYAPVEDSLDIQPNPVRVCASVCVCVCVCVCVWRARARAHGHVVGSHAARALTRRAGARRRRSRCRTCAWARGGCTRRCR